MTGINTGRIYRFTGFFVLKITGGTPPCPSPLAKGRVDEKFLKYNMYKLIQVRTTTPPL